MTSRKQLSFGFESLEARRVLAASLGWDGPGAGSAELTYYIGNSPSSLSQAQVTSAIETALQAWSNVVDVNFTQTRQPGLRDSLDFTFQRIDGAGGVLAQAYYPDDINSARIAGDVQFDSSERWEVGNALGSAAFDLVAVAVHEIGHALGLDHILEAGSILLPSISPSQSFAGLSSEDITAIQSLYAAADTSTTNTGSTDSVAQETPLLTENLGGSETGTRNPWGRFRWSVGFGAWWRTSGRIEAGTPQMHNFSIPTDVNGDLFTSPLDVLLVVNTLNNDSGSSEFMCDTNDDGSVSPIDALIIVNTLNQASNADTGSESTEAGDGTDSVATDLDQSLSDGNQSGESGEDADPSGTDDASMNTADTDTSSSDSDGGDIDDTGDGSTDSDGEDERLDDTGDDTEETDEDDCEHDDSLDSSARGIEHGEHGGHLLRGLGPLLGGHIDRAIQTLFDEFDADADGGLTESEVPAFVWQRLLDKGLDTNADSTITLEEIEAFGIAKRQERFNELDVNEDGILDSDELSKLAWNRLQNADRDGDGGLSFAELEAFRQLSRFERLDANLDGEITESEVSAFLWTRLVMFDADESSGITAEEFPQPPVHRPLEHIARAAGRLFRHSRYH